MPIIAEYRITSHKTDSVIVMGGILRSKIDRIADAAEGDQRNEDSPEHDDS
jgi:hypothetical protein